MNIDYFCFTVPNLDSSDFVITEKDDENTRWVKDQDLKLMKKASNAGMLIIFDRETQRFYKDSKPIDIRGLKIFPRSFIPYEKELIQKLEEAGANSIQTTLDRQKIILWPDYIQPEYRQITHTTYEEFVENWKVYREKFVRLFFKTAEKSHNSCHLKMFGKIQFEGQEFFVTKPTLWHMKNTDHIFLSELYNHIEDKENNKHSREYRMFVVDGEMLDISRSYIDDPTEVPNKVKEFGDYIINKTSKVNNFPKSYVVDLEEMEIAEKNVVDIIEFNPIASSGLEICNDLVGDYLKIRSYESDFEQ